MHSFCLFIFIEDPTTIRGEKRLKTIVILLVRRETLLSFGHDRLRLGGEDVPLEKEDSILSNL